MVAQLAAQDQRRSLKQLATDPCKVPDPARVVPVSPGEHGLGLLTRTARCLAADLT